MKKLEFLNEIELEITQLIVEGCSNTKIAEKLEIGVNTVEYHIRNTINKLEHNRKMYGK